MPSIHRLTAFERRVKNLFSVRLRRSRIKKRPANFLELNRERIAVLVFHDENSNGQLDANSLGILSEGVGASNDANSHMGLPKFDAAAFQFAGARVSLKITIHYL